MKADDPIVAYDVNIADHMGFRALAYLVAFVMGSAFLLVVSQRGHSMVLVLFALLGFTVISTLWVRSQYVDALDGRQWLLPAWLGLGLVACSLVGLGFWRNLQVNWLGVTALGALWLGGSSIISRLRDDTATWDRTWFFQKPMEGMSRHPMPVGVALIVGGACAILELAVLLLVSPNWAMPGFIAMAAVLLLVLPVGISLLSESTIRRLTLWSSARRKAWLGVAAAVLAFAMAIAVVVGKTKLMPVIFGAIVLIVAALASSTQAETAVLVAALALLTVGPQSEPTSAKQSVVSAAGDSAATLVALGDSYMSGEGANIFHESTNTVDGNQCRRAPTAWPALLADDKEYDAFEFLACSGAVAGNLLYETVPTSLGDGLADIPINDGEKRYKQELIDRKIVQRQFEGEPPQLDQWKNAKKQRNLDPTMVLVSIGGNDAGFSTIATMCLAPGECDKKRQQWERSLDQIKPLLRLAYSEVDATFSDRVPVVVVGYPEPIAEEPPAAPAATPATCQQVTFTPDERGFIRDFVRRLNGIVAATATEFGFHYVADMATALSDSHLQLCDPHNYGRPGLNFVDLSAIQGAAEQRLNPQTWIHNSLHPNERGHAAMLKSFRGWLAKQKSPLPGRTTADPPATDLNDTRTLWAKQAPQEAEKVVNSSPPCELYGSERACNTDANRWIVQQISGVVLWGWILCVLVGFLAWLGAVMLLAERRVAHQAAAGQRQAHR